jgi:hypothetical protein
MESDRLTKLHLIASIASSIAIPITIAIMGWLVQSGIATQGIRKDYVQIAITVLSTPEKQADPDLRIWATTVLQQNSPVPFPSALIDRLPSIGLISSTPYPMPAKELMEPPLKLPVSRENLAPTPEQLINIYQLFDENRLKLEFLQKSIRGFKDVDDSYRSSPQKP